MFKDLKGILKEKEKKEKNISPDARITCNILEKLYWHVNRCLQADRSEIKLNWFEKGAVSGGLERVMPGTKEYIERMYDSDIKLLLDDIEKELAKRKK